MKTIKDDWHFVAGENQSKLPPIQENRIFHALTAAYQNSHHQDLFKTTQMIVKKEKELCETALSELGKVGEDTGGPSDTLNLLMDHYNSRLILAVNKEKVIDKLAEDSQQMLEEYKGKTHELAEVKRTLMESQSKLRELSKVTEKLTKKEEELRFIESNLRQGIESNKRDILNGLYEIVLEIGESSPLPIEVPSHIEALPAKNISVEKSPENLLAKLESPKQALTAAPKPTEAKTDSNTNVKPETIKATQVATPKASDLKSPLKSPFPIPERAESKQVAPAPPSEMRIPASLSGLAQLVSNSKLNAEKNEIEEVRVFEEKKKEGKPTFAPIPTANVPPLLINPVNQDTAEFSVPQMHGFQNQQSESIAFESADPMYLLQVAESQRFFEPDREACSKSLVKTPDGAVIAEYFYLT